MEPLIYQDAGEKRANALEGWQRNIAVKNQGTIWTVPTDNVIKEKHFNGFHLNEEGTVELPKLINNKIAQITEKGSFSPISNVLATSIYGAVKKEYRFGCKLCTENTILKMTVHTLTQTKDHLPHQREVTIQRKKIVMVCIRTFFHICITILVYCLTKFNL